MGTPSVSRISAKIGKARSRPMPRLLLALVRLALSNDVLEPRPIPPGPAIFLSAEAISSAWSRLSSAHGPAISASGSPLPKRVLPMATIGLGAGSTFIAGDHAPAIFRGQPSGCRHRPPATETAMGMDVEVLAPLWAASSELANRTPALRQWPFPVPQRVRPYARKPRYAPPSTPHSTRRGRRHETARRRAAPHGKYRAARSRNGCGTQPDPSP